MVALEGTDTEEVTKLIMASAESAGRQEASKVARTSYRSRPSQSERMPWPRPDRVARSASHLAERRFDRWLGRDNTSGRGP